MIFEITVYIIQAFNHLIKFINWTLQTLAIKDYSFESILSLNSVEIRTHLGYSLIKATHCNKELIIKYGTNIKSKCSKNRMNREKYFNSPKLI